MSEKAERETAADEKPRPASAGADFFDRHPHLLLLSPLALAGIYCYVFRLFHAYDWNHPLVKLGCFAALFALVFYLTGRRGDSRLPALASLIELLAFGALFLYVLWCWEVKYLALLAEPPLGDIGASTQEAARTLFRLFENPYQSRTLDFHSNDPGYPGFKYGPVMMLGYLPAAFFPRAGYKLTSLLYESLSLACLGLLAWRRGSPPLSNLSTLCFVLALAVLPERVGYELFYTGVNDVFPVLLLLLSLIFLRRGDEFAAGLCAGLSFSAKFAPALFFIALLFRREWRRRFLLGVAAGLLPNVPFLIWDYRSFLDNVFLFNAVKQYDSTSLYSITPAPLHPVFSLIQFGALAFAVARNFSRRVQPDELAASFVLLLLVVEATYRQVHANHLLWFVPFLALLIGRNRFAPRGVGRDAILRGTV